MDKKPMFPGLRPEQELVLASIRLDRAQDDRICEFLKQELDWPVVLKVVGFNKVLPLFYQRLMALGQEGVPAKVMSSLKQRYQAIVFQNLRLTNKLLRLLDLLDSHSLDCIPFKGPTFAIQAYHDLSLRYFTDLDVLVHKRDIPRIYTLLTDCGYVPEIPLGIIGPKRLVRANKDFQFIIQNDFLEVHGEIVDGANAFPIPPEYFWRERQSIRLLGQELYTLSPENNLLMVCLQACGDRWEQLKWIADIAYFCHANPDLDWPIMFERAHCLGFHRMLCLALQLAEDPGGADFVPEVHSLFLADKSAGALAKDVRSKLAPYKGTPRVMGNSDFFLRSRERLRDRFYYLFDKAFIPKQTDWISIPLPDTFSALYYIIRPLRLLIKFSPIFLSLLFRRLQQVNP